MKVKKQILLKSARLITIIALSNLTKIGKKSNVAIHDENHASADTMKYNINLVNREGFEGSDASSKPHDEQKTTLELTENSNYACKTKDNQRRERDSNPRDLAVTSFMFSISRLAPYQARRPRLILID